MLRNITTNNKLQREYLETAEVSDAEHNKLKQEIQEPQPEPDTKHTIF